MKHSSVYSYINPSQLIPFILLSVDEKLNLSLFHGIIDEKIEMDFTIMANGTYQKILVPVDGSKETPLVMKRAIQAALNNDAHLDILNVAQINQVTEGFATLTDMSDGKTHELVQIIEKRLRDLEQQAKDAGVKSVAIHIRFGNPKLVISRDFIRDHHNDLIVMGGTGTSRIERLLLGSTTGYVVRMDKCDVIVARESK